VSSSQSCFIPLALGLALCQQTPRRTALAGAPEGSHRIPADRVDTDRIAFDQPFQAIGGGQVEEAANLGRHNGLTAGGDGALHRRPQMNYQIAIMVIHAPASVNGDPL